MDNTVLHILYIHMYAVLCMIVIVHTHVSVGTAQVRYHVRKKEGKNPVSFQEVKGNIDPV